MSSSATETPPPEGEIHIPPVTLEVASKNNSPAEPNASETCINEDAKPPKSPEAPLLHLEKPQSLKTQSVEAQQEPKSNHRKLPEVDPYAPRLGVGAEIWKTYVEEADKWDKELSEGWNKMLDVILIFAALFSAISTAFVIESSKSLKPDPAESSAATLRTLTLVLLAMPNQSALTTIALPPNESVFSPSTSAVAVNMLWFLSLILSVAVTLVAMLAKEWCHLFMAGRTGQMHDQARRRQLRLEGLRKWKMEGVITTLPTLMHLALSGLCVYLWEIHIGVAIPVILISATAAMLYLSAIFLPFIHDFCPYETALSRLLKPSVPVWVRAWFAPRGNMTLSESTSLDIPMDHLTSRVLSWLILNCENPKSVDVALQSIAGADRTLPYGLLWECNPVELIAQRIHGCFAAHQLSMDTDLCRLGEVNPERYSSAIVYARSLNVLVAHQRSFIESNHETWKKLRETVLPLRFFYECLAESVSISVAAVGTTGYLLPGLPPYHAIRKPRDLYWLDDLFKLVSSAQTQPKPPPSQTPLLCNLFYSLSSNISIRNRRRNEGYFSRDSARPRLRILKQTLGVLSCTPTEMLHIAPIAQFFTMATLGLNEHLLVHFTTLDTSLLPVFRKRPEDDVERQHTTIEELKPVRLLLLGLSGLVEACGHTAESVEPDDIDIVFNRLNELDIDWGTTAAFEPLVSANMFDLRRYVVKTMFTYHQRLTARDSSASLPACIKLLRSMLNREWDDASWIPDLACNALTGSTSDEIRDPIAAFLHQNPVSISRHPQLHNLLYEMLRRSRHHSSSYFDWNHSKYLRSITLSLRSFAAEDTESAVGTLLERLVNHHLLGTLMLCAYGSDGSHREDGFWQGIHCKDTTRFWGEQIITLFRQSNSRQTLSDGRDNTTMVNQLREFCLAQDEFPVETDHRNEHKPSANGESRGRDEREHRRAWAKELQKHLKELKIVLLREMNISPDQPAKPELQNPSAQAIQHATGLENDQQINQPHIVVDVSETLAGELPGIGKTDC